MRKTGVDTTFVFREGKALGFWTAHEALTENDGTCLFVTLTDKGSSLARFMKKIKDMNFGWD
jgi:hypothetical protein